MSNPYRAHSTPALLTIGVLSLCLCAPFAAAQTAKVDHQAELKPDVAALLKQSTDLYKKMKSYRHTAKWSFTTKAQDSEIHDDVTFTLALERPNRFVYKMDSKSLIFPPAAAYSDGVNFINFKARNVPTPTKQYTKVPAPASYKGINIVDDVEFQPIATYVIALMLQGDALADKDVRAAMEKATLKPPVTENGKKWQVIEMVFGPEETLIDLYFGQDDHLIGKANQTGDTRITESIESVKIDKPIEASVFQYTLPPDAKRVERFSAPQRIDDAMLRRNRSYIVGVTK
jgi:outer membrane lipoprotein-sorting protein